PSARCIFCRSTQPACVASLSARRTVSRFSRVAVDRVSIAGNMSPPSLLPHVESVSNTWRIVAFGGPFGWRSALRHLIRSTRLDATLLIRNDGNRLALERVHYGADDRARLLRRGLLIIGARGAGFV